MNHRQVSHSDTGSEDEAIRQILMRVLDKWRLNQEEQKEELEKTVILSSKGIGKEIPPRPVQAKETQEVLAETVILSSENIGKERPPAPIQVKEVQEVLPETVILSRQAISKETGQVGPVPKPQEDSKDDLFLKETIILKPGRGRDPQKK